jgi:DNA segregation ATPase FtsK/SpoIIIE-like protein
LNKPALIRLEGGMLLIDLERPDRQKLWFRDIREQLPPPSPTGNARMLVGVDLKGVTRFAELPSECPHVLAAGTTGSGKSEWLRTALASLILTNTPQTLRIMLIDPKRVTFHEVSRSPFLFEQSPALYTPEEAIEGLNRLRDVMEQRYVELSRHGCADLPELQRKAGTEAPPRIVCFCDEYGNLVAEKKNRERMEAAINQLGAKARAAGIHLIVATQDPRAQILSPTLKSNLGGRVCLKTTSATQSRMMLEESGAEALLGHGDLLFKTTGEPVRLQAPLLETEERQAIFAPRAAHG